MFELGRDLRKLFAQARDSDDLSWVELIGVDLLAVEAKAQTTDAGRVSCTRPFMAYLRASALWREHARRAGSDDSVTKALGAAGDAARHARSPDEVARAATARAAGLLLRYDLLGGRDALDHAAEAVPGSGACRIETLANIAAVHARIRARRARLSGVPSELMDAAALLDAAIHALRARPASETDDLRMDRAALTLEAGVTQRDPHLLDQAGRELQRLVAQASPDYRPLTRARALTLCGAGLSALATLAGDDEAQAQGRLLFDAAADQFTPDHSPLDWVVIQIVRAGTAGTVPLSVLRQAEALTAGRRLVLGAMVRERLAEAEIAAAAIEGDLKTIRAIEAAARRRLTDRTAGHGALDWAVDQIVLARVGRAVSALTGQGSDAADLALMEAADAAREHGAPALAIRAEAMLRGATVRV